MFSYVWTEARDQCLSGILFYCPPSYFWVRISYCAQISRIQVHWIVPELQESSYLCTPVPKAKITNICYHIWILCGCWGSKSTEITFCLRYHQPLLYFMIHRLKVTEAKMKISWKKKKAEKTCPLNKMYNHRLNPYRYEIRSMYDSVPAPSTPTVPEGRDSWLTLKRYD